MPDNSAGPTRSKLRPGRKPVGLPPQIPYRVDEWGKARVSFLPEGKDGPTRSKRGPPSTGTLAVYIGEKTKHPPRDPAEAGFTVRVVLQGFAYTEEEASDRVDAFIRKRLTERAGKTRQRTAKRS
jgi:hypothetical protein